MENLTRRHFIGSAAAMAAGAAVGLTTDKMVISETMVEFRAYLFSKEPIVIKGSVCSDKAKDLFRIRTFDDKGGQISEVQMPLARIKTLVRTSYPQCFQAKVQGNYGAVEHIGLTAAIENEKFILQATNMHSAAFWTETENIRRVV